MRAPGCCDRSLSGERVADDSWVADAIVSGSPKMKSNAIVETSAPVSSLAWRSTSRPRPSQASRDDMSKAPSSCRCGGLEAGGRSSVSNDLVEGVRGCPRAAGHSDRRTDRE